MWARQTRPAVSARAGGGLRVYQCARYLPLGGKLIEQLGELICQDAIPACEHKNQDWEQPRPPGQVMGPISICVRVRSGSKPGWVQLLLVSTCFLWNQKKEKKKVGNNSLIHFLPFVNFCHFNWWSVWACIFLNYANVFRKIKETKKEVKLLLDAGTALGVLAC